MSDDRALRLERIRWRSRRGLLEMDLVLTRFMEQYLENLNEEELLAYTELLLESDNDLLDFVNARANPSSEKQQKIVDLWRLV